MMARRGERIAAAARQLVGVPFRLHGRSAEAGVDCVGLVLLAMAAAGRLRAEPGRYGLRGGDAETFAGWMKAAGLRRVRKGRPGDLMLVRPGPAQFHLMICVEGGTVHAHAGLRRVVEMPGAPPWPIIGRWRDGR
ncbi:peptidoglycan endopeptidase [Sphingobium aquiterrae]|uniref:peptidoglycan endopeptidase n=1 Tax=Sphingobium aquiterrae TaxID=2038656 RepID=UPI00301AFE82